MSLKRISRSLPLMMLLMGSIAAACMGQEADSRFPGQKNDPDQPVGLRETQQKMRIEQAKKEYEEMLDRGEQALKLSEDIEKAYSQQPAMTRADIEKLDGLEKLVKKIRSGLGGDDDNEDDPPDDVSPKTAADGIKVLQSLTSKLVDELKKTSRFGISAVAIQSTNSVLKVVRFLRGSK